DGAACDDGNACTMTDTCMGGECVGQGAKLCATPDCAFPSECKTDTAACITMPGGFFDGESCGGTACMAPGTCAGGKCGGAPLPDGTPCPGGTCEGGACMQSMPAGSSSTGANGAAASSSSAGGGGGAGPPGEGGCGCAVPATAP